MASNGFSVSACRSICRPTSGSIRTAWSPCPPGGSMTVPRHSSGMAGRSAPTSRCTPSNRGSSMPRPSILLSGPWTLAIGHSFSTSRSRPHTHPDRPHGGIRRPHTDDRVRGFRHAGGCRCRVVARCARQTRTDGHHHRDRHVRQQFFSGCRSARSAEAPSRPERRLPWLQNGLLRRGPPSPLHRAVAGIDAGGRPMRCAHLPRRSDGDMRSAVRGHAARRRGRRQHQHAPPAPRRAAWRAEQFAP